MNELTRELPTIPGEPEEDSDDCEIGEGCPICLASMDGKDKFKFGCNHEVHANCFLKYVRINPHSKRCPLCRKTIDI